MISDDATLKQAGKCAVTILSVCPNSRLKRVYLFGPQEAEAAAEHMDVSDKSRKSNVINSTLFH